MLLFEGKSEEQILLDETLLQAFYTFTIIIPLITVCSLFIYTYYNGGVYYEGHGGVQSVTYFTVGEIIHSGMLKPISSL